jgi:hypothetical protein
MNTTDTPTVAPEVRDFLTAVRAQLADLDPEEQRDILDGLEADLTDLVTERGRGALGDPVDYARELRAAAGLEPEVGGGRRRMSLSRETHSFLDEVHHVWDRLVGRLPGDPQGLLDVLRPVWWVLRGWIAVQVAAVWWGDWGLTFVPGGDLRGVAAVVLGVALSVQLGRGRLWPADGWRRIAVLRLVLVGLNCFAVAMVPVVLNGLDHSRISLSDGQFRAGFNAGFRSAAQQAPVTRKKGVYVDGTWVSNIYPYDAKGRPLVGVQLFNQIGQPINVVTQPEYEDASSRCVIDDNGECDPADQGNPMPRVFYPWTNGATQLLNVFPIPSRVQQGEQPSATAFSEGTPPTIGPFPLASVPKVSVPGIEPSVVKPSGLQPAAR